MNEQEILNLLASQQGPTGRFAEQITFVTDRLGCGAGRSHWGRVEGEKLIANHLLEAQDRINTGPLPTPIALQATWIFLGGWSFSLFRGCGVEPHRRKVRGGWGLAAGGCGAGRGAERGAGRRDPRGICAGHS